jgi:hypothetical protein
MALINHKYSCSIAINMKLNVIVNKRKLKIRTQKRRKTFAKVLL